jgi:hypothetical protein
MLVGVGVDQSNVRYMFYDTYFKKEDTGAEYHYATSNNIRLNGTSISFTVSDVTQQVNFNDLTIAAHVYEIMKSVKDKPEAYSNKAQDNLDLMDTDMLLREMVRKQNKLQRTFDAILVIFGLSFAFALIGVIIQQLLGVSNF